MPPRIVGRGFYRLSHQGSHLYAAAAKSLQSCQTLCDPIDGSPPGSPIPGILQARTLEWVAISFSNAWKWKVKVKLLSRVWLLATPWTRLLHPWDFPGNQVQKRKKGELCRDVGSVLLIVIIFPILLSFTCLFNQTAQSSAQLGYVISIQDNSFYLMCLFW